MTFILIHCHGGINFQQSARHLCHLWIVIQETQVQCCLPQCSTVIKSPASFAGCIIWSVMTFDCSLTVGLESNSLVLSGSLKRKNPRMGEERRERVKEKGREKKDGHSRPTRFKMRLH